VRRTTRPITLGIVLVAYALGEDAGSGSGAVQLGGLPMSGQQFGDLLGRVIGDAGQAYTRLISCFMLLTSIRYFVIGNEPGQTKVSRFLLTNSSTVIG
jgi:hypothetical protein